MATIGDVARHLGISRSTVSYALSGKRPVSAEMKERIDEAISELDYWPSAAARALATAHSNTLALLAPMLENVTPAVAAQFVNGVAIAARAHGYDILLVTGHEAFDGVERLVRANQVDGFVVLDVEDPDRRVAILAGAPQPAVLIGLQSEDVGLDCVDLDWYAAGELLVKHLTDLGHTKLCLLGPPQAAFDMGMTYANRFRAGAHAAVDAVGANAVTIAVGNSYEARFDAVLETLRANPEVTGVVVQHEIVIAPLMAALRELDRRVPQDISVVGVSLDVLDPGFIAPISGVSNPSTEITQTAVSMLVDRISGTTPTARTLAFPVNFYDGATSAPPHP